MHKLFSLIKAVGFDLDRTLYTDTPEMRGVIYNTMATKALELKPSLKSVDKVIKKIITVPGKLINIVAGDK